MRPSSRRVITVAALFLGLGLGEVALRLAVPRSRLLDATTDEYWRALAREHPEPPDQWPDTVFDPRLGWRMKPDFAQDAVHHDARGFRRTIEKVGERVGENAARPVLVIGDSFTYGLGVGDEDTYASMLASVTGANVVNAGVNGYGMDQAVLMWECEGRALSPGVVILGVQLDGFYRNGLCIREAPKPRFVATEDGSTYRLEGLGAGAGTESSASSFLLDAARYAARVIGRKLGRLDEGKLRRLEPLSEYLLERLRDSVTASDARLLVVIFGPSYDGQAEDAWIEASLRRSCQKLAIHCVDLPEERRTVKASSWYGPNGHFSREGNRAAAAAISTALDSWK